MKININDIPKALNALGNESVICDKEKEIAESILDLLSAKQIPVMSASKILKFCDRAI